MVYLVPGDKITENRDNVQSVSVGDDLTRINYSFIKSSTSSRTRIDSRKSHRPFTETPSVERMILQDSHIAVPRVELDALKRSLDFAERAF